MGNEGFPWIEEPRFKVRLVAKDFTQVDVIYYNEFFYLL